MPPPPRPPIICYDMQINNNARRSTLVRKKTRIPDPNRYTSKVTVVRKNLDDLATASAWWDGGDYEFELGTISEQMASVHLSKPERPVECRKLQNCQPPCNTTVTSRPKTTNYSRQQPFEETSRSAHQNNARTQVNTAQARHNYSQKLRRDAEVRERNKLRKLKKSEMLHTLDAHQAELDLASKSLESLSRAHGMSHNTARYIKRQDEDILKLQKKIDEYAFTRSKELSRNVRQMKRIHDIQKTRCQTPKKPTPTKVTFREDHGDVDSTLGHSPSSDSTNDSAIRTDSSSALSHSSCSSLLSLEDLLPSRDQRAGTKGLRRSPRLLSSSILKDNCINESKMSQSPHDTLDQFSFYKAEPVAKQVIEVPDREFYAAIEDQTMMEFDRVYGNIESFYHKILDLKNDLG